VYILGPLRTQTRVKVFDIGQSGLGRPGNPAVKPPFLLVPPSKGLEIAVSPIAIDISEDAYRIEGAVKFSASNEEKFSESEIKEREDVLNEIKDTRFPGAQECGPALPSVSFKNLGLGPADKLWEALLKVAAAAKTQMNVEKARLDLAIAIFQGKDVGAESRQLLKRELENANVQFGADEAIVVASIANAKTAIGDADAKRRKWEQDVLRKVDIVPGAPKPSAIKREAGKLGSRACRRHGRPC
jgi:hypothetical protein